MSRLTFAKVVGPYTEDWVLNSNPSTRIHFKTFLVAVPLPIVTTTFKTAGMYKNWL